MPLLTRLLCLFGIVAALVGARPASAARATFVGAPARVPVGTEFDVTLTLAAENDDLNAIEGVLRFPRNVLEVVAVRTGESVVSLWAERPGVTSSGAMPFSGVMLGGYIGQSGSLFGVRFRALQPGDATVELEGFQALRNDGRASAASASSGVLAVKVVNEPSLAQPTGEPAADQSPPDAFTVDVASDPSVFSGKRFVVFGAQDKQTGIARYEVSENGGPWVPAESPFLLGDQRGAVEVRVRAIDGEGNMRDASGGVGAGSSLLWQPLLLLVALVVAGALLATVARWYSVRRVG